MKASQKYYNSLKKENQQIGYSRLEPRFNGSQLELYGEICRLEGKINSLNSFGTNHWVDKLLPRYKKQLKEISKEHKL